MVVSIGPELAGQLADPGGRVPERRTIAWRSACLLFFGSTLLVTVSLGTMSGELGAALVVVWTVTAFVGLLQCLLLAELASRYPNKLGGAPAYIHESFKNISPVFGALSSWAYWLAWIPGVAVNLMLAARYIAASFFPGVNVAGLTLVLGAMLYAANWFGLRLSVWTSGAMALCALPPLVVIMAMPLFRPSMWNGHNLWPLLPDGMTWLSVPAVLLLSKWMFVAAWSSYGAEMVATVVGELREPKKDIPKAIGFTALATLLGFAIVPIVLVGIVGAERLGEDPYVVFLTAATEVLGRPGALIVSIMLTAALLLGAQLFVISSSRALYQMSADGLTLTGYSTLNRHGVPVGSMRWDALVTLSMLAVFGDNLVDIVAAANVCYLVVFVLLPLAYVSVRARPTPVRADFRLPGIMVPVAMLIMSFNAALLILGGVQWGLKVIGVGAFMVLTFLPFYLYRRAAPLRSRRWHRAEAMQPSAGGRE